MYYKKVMKTLQHQIVETNPVEAKNPQDYVKLRQECKPKVCKPMEQINSILKTKYNSKQSIKDITKVKDSLTKPADNIFTQVDEIDNHNSNFDDFLIISNANQDEMHDTCNNKQIVTYLSSLFKDYNDLTIQCQLGMLNLVGTYEQQFVVYKESILFTIDHCYNEIPCASSVYHNKAHYMLFLEKVNSNVAHLFVLDPVTYIFEKLFVPDLYIYHSKERHLFKSSALISHNGFLIACISPSQVVAIDIEKRSFTLIKLNSFIFQQFGGVDFFYNCVHQGLQRYAFILQNLKPINTNIKCQSGYFYCDYIQEGIIGDSDGYVYLISDNFRQLSMKSDDLKKQKRILEIFGFSYLLEESHLLLQAYLKWLSTTQYKNEISFIQDYYHYNFSEILKDQTILDLWSKDLSTIDSSNAKLLLTAVKTFDLHQLDSADPHCSKNQTETLKETEVNLFPVQQFNEIQIDQQIDQQQQFDAYSKQRKQCKPPIYEPKDHIDSVMKTKQNALQTNKQIFEETMNKVNTIHVPNQLAKIQISNENLDFVITQDKVFELKNIPSNIESCRISAPILAGYPNHSVQVLNLVDCVLLNQFHIKSFQQLKQLFIENVTGTSQIMIELKCLPLVTIRSSQSQIIFRNMRIGQLTIENQDIRLLLFQNECQFIKVDCYNIINDEMLSNNIIKLLQLSKQE